MRPPFSESRASPACRETTARSVVYAAGCGGAFAPAFAFANGRPASAQPHGCAAAAGAGTIMMIVGNRSGLAGRRGFG